MVHAQQVERAADVVLLPNALRCMPLNLRADSARDVEPLAQGGEAPAQAVQGQPVQPGSSTSPTVRNAGAYKAAGCAANAHVALGCLGAPGGVMSGPAGGVLGVAGQALRA